VCIYIPRSAFLHHFFFALNDCHVLHILMRCHFSHFFFFLMGFTSAGRISTGLAWKRVQRRYHEKKTCIKMRYLTFWLWSTHFSPLGLFVFDRGTSFMTELCKHVVFDRTIRVFEILNLTSKVNHLTTTLTLLCWRFAKLELSIYWFYLLLGTNIPAKRTDIRAQHEPCHLFIKQRQ
jgi:hypothetical protein